MKNLAMSFAGFPERTLLGLLALLVASCGVNAHPVPPATAEQAVATATATVSPTTAIPMPTATVAPTEPPITTLLFTGVIVPARCVQAAIDERGDPDYLYDEPRELIQSADLAIGTLNATISDYAPRTGCRFTYVLVGGSENADALARAGFDVMSVATNHIKNCGLTNCGDRAFFETLENLERVGILPVGAGENLAAAAEPVVVVVNGIRFGIVSLGQIEPMAFADEQTPGIAVLTAESLQAAVLAARAVADVVIAMPHWGPEDVANPNWSQWQLAPVAVAAGADLVVGNHTHVVQAVEVIDAVPVFYGLGNFVFDQTWSREHMQGIILLVRFQGTELLDYELIPTIVTGDGTVSFAEPDEAAEILARIEAASRRLPRR